MLRILCFLAVLSLGFNALGLDPAYLPDDIVRVVAKDDVFAMPMGMTGYESAVKAVVVSPGVIAVWTMGDMTLSESSRIVTLTLQALLHGDEAFGVHCWVRVVQHAQSTRVLSREH